MSHAWLFTGPPGSGRSNAAVAFAAALQCERGPGPDAGCGTCHECHTVLAGSHADVTVVRTEKLSIGVDEVRDLVRRSALAPVGRRWQVISVSQEEMLIDVKPGAAGALPSFEGAYAASIHRRVRQQMRGVLCADAPVPFIDQAGRALLDEARDNYRRLGLEANRLRQAGADVHLFLWSGDRIQDTLALLLQAKGFQATNHGIFLEVRAAERHQVESALGEIAEGPAVTAIELAETVQNKVREKWDELLPDDVLDASFAAGNLDVAGAVEEIRRGRDSLGADRSTADV